MLFFPYTKAMMAEENVQVIGEVVQEVQAGSEQCGRGAMHWTSFMPSFVLRCFYQLISTMG